VSGNKDILISRILDTKEDMRFRSLKSLENFHKKELPSDYVLQEKDLLNIAYPLLEVDVHEWDREYAEPIVIFLLSKYLSEEITQKYPKFVENLHLYERWLHGNSECKLKPPITADEILSVISPLVERTSSEWTKEEILNVVDKLKGIHMILASKSSSEAMEVYNKFMDRWGPFVNSRPYLSYELDPFIVVSVTGGAAYPVNYAPSIVGYPPIANPNIPALPPALIISAGGNMAWSFAQRIDAERFIGFMIGTNAGIHFLLINTTQPTFLY